jgi:tetratricopeptide (TPR) repeat protein
MFSTIIKSTLAAAAVALLSIDSMAQIQTPRPSPLATVTQKLALTEVTVVYSRPGAKSRKIYGDLVPFGEMWRTGANSITTVRFADAVSINNRLVPAGRYALLTIPGEKEWTVILSKDSALAGVSDYKQENDAARFMVRPRMLRESYESFTIDFSNFIDEGATLSILWENTAIDLAITQDIDSKIEAAISTTLAGDPTAVKASDYHSAAVHYMNKGKDLPKALVWMEKSLEMRPDAFWYVHRHAELLGKMGKKDEAIATAEKSLKMARENEDGDYGYVKRNEELIAKLKAN